MARLVFCNMSKDYSSGEVPQHGKWEERKFYSEILMETIYYSQCSRCGDIRLNVDKSVIEALKEEDENFRMNYGKSHYQSNELPMSFFTDLF